MSSCGIDRKQKLSSVLVVHDQVKAIVGRLFFNELKFCPTSKFSSREASLCFIQSQTLLSTTSPHSDGMDYIGGENLLLCSPSQTLRLSCRSSPMASQQPQATTKLGAWPGFAVIHPSRIRTQAALVATNLSLIDIGSVEVCSSSCFLSDRTLLGRHPLWDSSTSLVSLLALPCLHFVAHFAGPFLPTS